MATLRELKARIGSVASSEKITGAMKMISSAKMHKAEQALKRLKPYRSQVETIIDNLLRADTPVASPLMQHRDVHRLALVVLGSDDGLCGAYNVNIFKKVAAWLEEALAKYPQAAVTIIPVGSKILKQVSRLVGERVIVAAVEGVDSKSDDDRLQDFTGKLNGDFMAGNYDRVEVIFSEYITVSRQRITDKCLLPISLDDLPDDKAISMKPYIFEPSAERIFTYILPLYQTALVQDIFTQNRASEQAARVMAMQSANDNARKLLEQLRLEYNKLRQQSITNELLDIVGGQIR